MKYTTQDIVTLSEATARTARALILAQDALRRAEAAALEARGEYDKMRRSLRQAIDSLEEVTTP